MPVTSVITAALDLQDELTRNLRIQAARSLKGRVRRFHFSRLFECKAEVVMRGSVVWFAADRLLKFRFRIGQLASLKPQQA